jgi:formiminotetrahydrofolate cyclodeaminase
MAARTPAFEKKSLEKFLTELGSAEPSPGGGAAAALTGAQGAALLEMVARLNDARFRKKNAKADHSAARKRISGFAGLRAHFLRLLAQDAKAFEIISAAYSKGKEHPSYQKALLKGYSVPLEMAESVVKALTKGLEERERTSKWLYSDLAEAGILLDAAFGAARLNVEINLNDLKDRDLAGRVRAKLDALQSESARLKHVLTGGISA